MTHKTRKNYTQRNKNYTQRNVQRKHIHAKKGTQTKCKLKTCRSKIYKAVYGGTNDGTIRSLRQLYF